MRKTIAILPLLVGVVATPAYAQDIGTGARAEIRAGYDEINVGVEFDGGVMSEQAAESNLAFGAEVGFDARVGEGLVAGIYGGVDFTRVDGCGELFGREDEQFEDRFCVQGGRNIYLGGRLGIPTGDGGLIYAKAGFSNADFTAEYSDFAASSFEATNNAGGWHVGAGFELPVVRNIYVKGEYVHTSYGELFGSEFGAENSIRANRHQIMGGVGMRFGALGGL